MNTFKARGLVLREYEAGESDKRIVLLCKKHGRILVYARGARKAKSKFLAASQLFTYGDYVIADGGQFFSMGQAEVIENFYPIRQDYDKLCCAQYVLEVCEKTIPERSPDTAGDGCDELLRLVLKTLQHISKGSDFDARQALQVFMFRFYLFYGLAPEMGSCCLCGQPLTDNAAIFCDQGMLCSTCKNPSQMPLSLAAQAAIRHILRSSLNEAFMFRAGDTVLRELTLASKLCFLSHFQIALQTEI